MGTGVERNGNLGAVSIFHLYIQILRMFNNKANLKKILLLLAFIEGGAVMTCELAGAKILAPVFGNSLYVWASVLGVTLGALASGYLLGGIMSIANFKKEGIILYIILLLAAFFMVIMPHLSSWIFHLTYQWDIRWGSVFSLILYMLPPLLFMGMSSPMIIQMITAANGSAGKNAGLVYSVSTVGGIAFTFIAGFYLLPEKGISFSLLSVGVLLALIPLLFLVVRLKFILMPFIIALSALIFALRPPGTDERFGIVQYKSEGILGQIKVIDFISGNEPDNKAVYRTLLVNNTSQTIINLHNPLEDSDNSYVSFISKLTDIYSPEEVLLLGLGGGNVVNNIAAPERNIDVVEIDERIKDVAIKYFDLDTSASVYIDDARHFLKTAPKPYDAIIYDLFLSETPPSHLYTIECFNEVKMILRKEGMIMINFYGFISGEEGKASRALYNTLKSVFKEVEIIKTQVEWEEKHRNLIFVAGENISEPLKQEGLKNYIIDKDLIDFKNEPILTDDAPLLEKLYLKPASAWRKSFNKYYLRRIMGER
jgi:spermidine synthase